MHVFKRGAAEKKSTFPAQRTALPRVRCPVRHYYRRAESQAALVAVIFVAPPQTRLLVLADRDRLLGAAQSAPPSSRHLVDRRLYSRRRNSSQASTPAAMAANYWTSSQHAHFTFSRAHLEKLRTETELETGYTRAALTTALGADHRHLRIFLHAALQQLGRRLSLRQQALATAEIYLARFYLRTAVQETNPFLVLATCVYLACKMEECPQHIRSVVTEAKALWPDFITLDATKLAECEFYLIEELDAYLIVHHPYRALVQLSRSLGSSGYNLGLSPDEMQTAWYILNDALVTDVPFLYPPNVAAMTAIYLALVLRPQLHRSSTAPPAPSPITPTGPTAPGAVTAPSARLEKTMDWFAASGIDLEHVVDCAQELISLYQMWAEYNEKQCRDVISAFVLGRQQFC
ncbi:cyclin-like protein [Limtongia smithiae]|uniref:cyclin-like protein n=1 Tax=Limtongia smithiae TaxID=1125753 RepID=UPI0034CD9847